MTSATSQPPLCVACLAERDTSRLARSTMGCHGFALLAFLWGACFISVARAFVPTPPALLRPSHQQVQSRHVQTGATSVSPVDATHPAVRSPRGGALRMGFGDILNKALANEDMGDRKIQNPGLKGDIKWCMVRDFS